MEEWKKVYEILRDIDIHEQNKLIAVILNDILEIPSEPSADGHRRLISRTNVVKTIQRYYIEQEE